jgi:hypothetical protein
VKKRAVSAFYIRIADFFYIYMNVCIVQLLMFLIVMRFLTYRNSVNILHNVRPCIDKYSLVLLKVSTFFNCMIL